LQVTALAWGTLIYNRSISSNACLVLKYPQALRVAAVYRVSSRDSGKTAVDAALGEVMVTCEKMWWLVKHGQRWLKPEHRSAGIMVSLMTLLHCFSREKLGSW
jgi:hypothetical protein